MKNSNKMYQVSTLQALAMGYTKPVITVGELLGHGDTGLGTFENVDGERILTEGCCYRADENGAVSEMPGDTGVPFAAVSFLQAHQWIEIPGAPDMDSLKSRLDVLIEEVFGLNSMHLVRIDGDFAEIRARSEAPYRSHHVSLKEILSHTQKDFCFQNISGTLICVYFPDFMDGINAPGWHLHFISSDRKLGGHVFELSMLHGTAKLSKIQHLEIQLPAEPAFDTYSLKQASQDEIKQVEQGKGK